MQSYPLASTHVKFDVMSQRTGDTLGAGLILGAGLTLGAGEVLGAGLTLGA